MTEILILFDMDGLIVDSEPLHCKAYQQIFKKHGVQMTDEEYYLELSTKGTAMSEICRKYGTPDSDPEAIIEEKIEIYLNLVEKELELMPGADEAVKTLKEEFSIVLASASRRVFVENILKRFGLENEFLRIFTGSEVSKRKPDPEIYNYASREMKIPPENCVVLEDAEKGVLAAYRAGMKCIAIPTIYNKGGDYSKATLTVNCIKEVTPELINSLF